MKANNIKKGSIVVVIEGKAFHNAPLTITKVLSKPGRIKDSLAVRIGEFYSNSTHLVMCAHPDSQDRCNNKPASYEVIADLRPATDHEKKIFQMNNNQPVQL